MWLDIEGTHAGGGGAGGSQQFRKAQVGAQGGEVRAVEQRVPVEAEAHGVAEVKGHR